MGLADKDGRLIESYTYDPFGKVSLFNHLTNQPFNQSSVGNNLLFAGREYDSESGFYYFRYRYYDPGLGRFINPEPQPDVFLVNLYDYVFNNPVNRLDPLGLTGGGGRGGKEPPPPDPQPGVGIVESGVYAFTTQTAAIPWAYWLFKIITNLEKIQLVKEFAEWTYEKYREYRDRQERNREERRK